MLQAWYALSGMLSQGAQARAKDDKILHCGISSLGSGLAVDAKGFQR